MFYVNLLSMVKILSVKPCDEIGSQYLSVSNLFDANSHFNQSKSDDFSKKYSLFIITVYYFIYIYDKSHYLQKKYSTISEFLLIWVFANNKIDNIKQ